MNRADSSEESGDMMIEPISLAIVTTYIAHNAPSWLDTIRGTLLDKGKEVALEKGKDFAVEKGTKYVRDFFHLDEKEQVRHLQLALKNAVERGITRFHTFEERDQYRKILEILFEPGSHSDTLRHEAMRLLTLSETPNFAELNEAYNRSLRTRSLSQPTLPTELDAAPYLASFFDALIAELYADPFFKQQMSDVLKVRAARATMNMERSVTEMLATLRQISKTLEDEYTVEQFEQDVQVYTAHMERSLRYLKLVGVVPKDRGEKNPDPELRGIFVPLRIALQEQKLPKEEKQDSITASLEHFPYLVLLGGPGSGKSTAVRYLAWSHMAANQSNASKVSIPLLAGNPLPLRIELRRLTEDRRHHPEYNFLSYATEVLLGREGVEIHPQMFKELLERRHMLLLFDGLDEVATLDERKQLTEEIEHFALCYPGNRIIVTSRPVGYELARLSSQWFTHAEVQAFNDEQIRQFLENWYTHVLRLFPLPYQDREELETLFKTLQENERLHKLAENPLLLTVITALHRYERLPDRRILVYDRCADLLLETWAKLKGTNVRWKDMKMGKEDQYACVAHLGFVLHERSQEQKSDDVPTRFMLREIEHFLENLITEKAERRAEAKRFLDLIREEAGLIAERGADESSELLYGFVHRTFQEYFAAADVYERYQQEEDPEIVSEFLKGHLHDPHWQEVILLLLGKLKRKPVTAQLCQVLEGKIKSRRSKYTDIVQQDLFFVSSCLTEEIIVENDLARDVVLRLGDLVKSSPFPSQSKEAMEVLGQLMQTRQYADTGREELRTLVAQEVISDIPRRIRAARTLYSISFPKSPEQQQAIQALLNLAKRTDISFELSLLAARTLYEHSHPQSQELLQAAQLILDLAQRPNISIEQSVLAAEILYWNSPDKSEEQQQVIKLLLSMTQYSNISIEQAMQIARILYESSSRDSEERRQANNLLGRLIQNSDLSFEQIMQAAEAIYEKRIFYQEGYRQATQMLLHLARRADVSFEQAVLASQTIYKYSSNGSEELRQAAQLLLHLARQSNLSFEQNLLITQATYLIFPTQSEKRGQITRLFLDLIEQVDPPIEQTLRAANILFQYSPDGSEGRFIAAKMLLNLLHQPNFSIEQILQAVQMLHRYSPKALGEKQALQILQQLMQRHALSFEQELQIAEFLYQNSSVASEEEQQTIKRLWQLAQKQNISADQRLQIAKVPLTVKKANYQERVQAVRMILSLIEGETARQYLEKYWQSVDAKLKPEPLNILYIAELTYQELLPAEARDEMYQILRNMVPQFDQIDAPNE